MTKRRLILVAIPFPFIGLVLGVLALLPARPGVTKANFDRIEEGMTMAEVEAILGPNHMGFGGADWMLDEFWFADDGSRASIFFAQTRTEDARVHSKT